jgi:hypothetical protein
VGLGCYFLPEPPSILDFRTQAIQGVDPVEISEAEFRALVGTIANGLNAEVFPRVAAALRADPALRRNLNRAFPFPGRLRVGVVPSHLLVEYVGEEDEDDPQFSVEGHWKPGWTVWDFLGIEPASISAAPVIPWPRRLENMQVFLGDAMEILGDYLYDIVANPQDLILNGVPDFTVATEPTFLSNVTFLYSDSKGSFRIRHIDFLELWPVEKGGWPYHSKESFPTFADFLVNYKVPSYSHRLHGDLNEFIRLVKQNGVREPTLTSYLAEHPQILQLAFGADALNPQVLLKWQDESGRPDLKPDFMPTKMDGYCDIVEFKLPSVNGSAVVGTASRKRPSAEVDAALAQIDEYQEWAEQDRNRAWLQAEKGLKVHSPHTYLVVGHRDEFTAEERQRLRRRRNATIYTYDEFIEMARMHLYRIR